MFASKKRNKIHSIALAGSENESCMKGTIRQAFLALEDLNAEISTFSKLCLHFGWSLRWRRGRSKTEKDANCQKRKEMLFKYDAEAPAIESAILWLFDAKRRCERNANPPSIMLLYTIRRSFFSQQELKKMVLVRWLVHHSKIWQKPFRWKLEILISLPSHVSWKSRKFSSKHHLMEDPGWHVDVRSNIIYF